MLTSGVALIELQAALLAVNARFHCWAYSLSYLARACASFWDLGNPCVTPGDPHTSTQAIVAILGNAPQRLESTHFFFAINVSKCDSSEHAAVLRASCGERARRGSGSCGVAETPTEAARPSKLRKRPPGSPHR